MLLYADEASVSVASGVTHTYAPIGKTPVIKVSTEINARLYMASAISPKGDLIYMIRNKPFNGDAIVEFLKMLLDDFDGKLLIIWDNASIHNCKATRSFLEKSTDAKRLYLVQQPKYAPELNADEQVWNYLKNKMLKNTCNQNIKELKPKIIKAMKKLKDQPKLICQFFKHPELGLMTN